MPSSREREQRKAAELLRGLSGEGAADNMAELLVYKPWRTFFGARVADE